MKVKKSPKKKISCRYTTQTFVKKISCKYYVEGRTQRKMYFNFIANMCICKVRNSSKNESKPLNDVVFRVKIM